LATAPARARDLHLEVNISARSLEDDDLGSWVLDQLSELDVRPGRLGLEMTETAAITNLDSAQRLVGQLTGAGCGFSLDDFGAGFGSFYYLKHIPVDFLKIDGDFVRGPRSRTDELVVGSIVSMAQGLGKQTIAECVEDAATLEDLRAAGVDFAQGFHIGRPVETSELMP
jgi:EAL domain-containing protein (putative c-di-GMP-specific phosphodiesterase class I)